MKTLSQLRTLFVDARNLAKEASPAKADQAAAKLRGISDHCKELYASATSYMERAKCRNIYESIDNVIAILLKYGFYNETVMAFFGLLDSKISPSFGDISRGKGNIKAYPAEPIAPVSVPAEPIETTSEDPYKKKGKRLVPPPPKAEIGYTADIPKEAGVVAEPEPKSEPSSSGADTGSGNNIIFPDSNPLEPESLDDFIGQEHVINQLKAEISAAKKLGKHHIDNILLLGNR